MPAKKRRFWKLLAWSFLLLTTSVIGGLWYAYSYATDSATIAQIVREHAPEYLPGCMVEVGKSQLKLLTGGITLNHVSVRQPMDGSTFQTLYLPWLHIDYDARASAEGRVVPLAIAVTHPILRLRQRENGTWNIQGFVADPFPDHGLISTPSITIENGKLEMIQGGGEQPIKTTLLREVSIRIAPSKAKTEAIAFNGTAMGDLFDRISLKGTIDRQTGEVTLGGDLARLVVSQTLRDRLPAEFKKVVDPIGLTGGIIDLTLHDLAFNSDTQIIHRKSASARVQSGVVNCPKMPFPLNNLRGTLRLKDDLVTIEETEADNGPTHLWVSGMFSTGDPADTPFDLKLVVKELELDERLKAWTPQAEKQLWDEFKPAGRLNLNGRASRNVLGAAVEVSAEIDCLDAAMEFHLFKYSLEHVFGKLLYENNRITLVGMKTLVDGKYLKLDGTIDNPGDLAIVNLEFAGESLPVNAKLLSALPPEVLQVVNEFQPSGSVRGHATFHRDPPTRPDEPKEGKITFDAWLDLNEGCRMKWAKLPYPIDNMIGQLEIHPDLWKFSKISGHNSTALLTGSGQVENIGRDAQGHDSLKVKLDLTAKNLPFDEQLRTSLPPEWQKVWATLNPTGSCSMDAEIRVEPGKPDHYHLEIQPKAETGIRLILARPAKPGIDPGGIIDMRMEEASGYFVYNDGTVTMRDVKFDYRGAPVRFDRGRVVVENNGQFDLAVESLFVKDFRLDAKLREMMPPVTAQFARRLDDGRPFTFYTDLTLAWPGPGAPVRCTWDKALVVLDGNTIQAGSMPITLQGELQGLRGQFDGENLTVNGLLNLNSLSADGQQVTSLESPLEVKDGVARLTNLRGTFLDGELLGSVGIALDATPRYAAKLSARGIDLESYARTLPGKQTYRGKVSGMVEFQGLGSDLHTLQGEGEARVTNANLGELNFVLQLLKSIKVLKSSDRTAFDGGYVSLKVQNGVSTFDPISLKGDPFSLLGKGTMGVQGDLNLRFDLLYGRDRFHLPFLSDAVRELGAQLYEIQVTGSPAFPKFDFRPLPQVGDTLKAITKAKDETKGQKRRR